MPDPTTSSSDADVSEVQLRRELSLLNGVTIVIGTIIGSGIFVTPKGVLEFSGESVGISIVIWILSGVVSLLGALCYAELGTTITKSGGDYAYIKEAFGDIPGFVQLWVNIIMICPTAQAIVSLTFAYYALQPIFPTCPPPRLAVQLLAALCITLLTWVNVMKVRWVARIQDVFTGAKLLALTTVTFTGIVLLCMGRGGNFEDFFSSKPIGASDIALAFYSGLFAFAGWQTLNIVSEELEDPAKNLPRAIFISLSIVTIIYVLSNMAYFTVLRPLEILESNAVAVTFAGRIYGRFAWIIPVSVSLSCFGGVNGLLFTSGRLNFVGAREGQLPPILGMIHVKRKIPVPAILFTSFLSLVMLLLPDMGVLVNYLSFVQWLSVAGSVLALLWLRRTRPHIPRTIKLPPVIPLAFLMVCIFLLIVPLMAKPREIGIGLLIVLSAVPVYTIGESWQRKQGAFTHSYGELFLRLFLSRPKRII
ncbi:Blood-brain barrier large neutral amino acid transporter [Fasciolopsis buskii]|uniref:Blood-brain barrier large neutral amino acid transporter n=1 Tax=Fasciolopsis buskii TaxID=27845 RepID=A0A8E0RN87_9TREM|nr:Blood-brain barrier large neutral amino acid transporter [Fasciolopsis buski]